jgi:hypothetical protein
MIVVVAAGEPPRVVEPEVLDRLEVQRAGSARSEGLGALGEFDPGTDHAWLRVDALKAAAVEAGVPDGWENGFDAMIRYATSRGWVDESGERVRAHVTDAGAPGDHPT